MGEVRERLEAIAVLNKQVERRGQEPLVVAETDEGTPAPEDPDALSLAQQLELCETVERDTERLRAEVESLGTSIALLNDRARGVETRGHERLAPPPRPVPVRYVLAEWATLPTALGAAAGAGAMLASGEHAGLVSGPALLAVVLAALRWVGVEVRLLTFIIVCGAGVVPIGGLSAWLMTLPFAKEHTHLLVGTSVVVALALDAMRARSRARFLARCRVAQARLARSEVGSTSYKNWNLPHSRGWTVTHESYTGSSRTSHVEYATEDGRHRTRTLRGREYEDGVVLYDPDAPERALVVHELGCAPRPDHRGQWTGALGFGRGLRVVLWACALVAFVVEAALRVVASF